MESNIENLSLSAHLRKFSGDQCSENYFSLGGHFLARPRIGPARCKGSKVARGAAPVGRSGLANDLAPLLVMLNLDVGLDQSKAAREIERCEKGVRA